MCYTNTRAAGFNKVSLQSLSLNQVLNKVFMQTFVLCLEVKDGKQETRGMRCSRSDRVKGSGEGCRKTRREHVSSFLFLLISVSSERS